MISFDAIRARAEARKGGAAALKTLLPPKPDPKALAALKDDRVLAEMAKRVFCAGFAWSVIETKWPGFEEAFHGFEPARLVFEPDEYWEKLARDTRIVRNAAKILSVRKNARFVSDIAKEHGSFGRFLAKWPSSRPGRPARAPRETRRPARRQYRPDVPEVPRLGRIRRLEGRRRLPARRRPRYRRGGEIEARPEARAGTVQRLGERDRPALRASLAHLRDSIGENYSAREIERRGRGDG